VQWTGSTVHITETCEDDLPSLITNVETSPSTSPDVALTQTIHQHLEEKDLLPGEHLLDQGYIDAGVLVESATEYGVDIVGRVRPDTSWQAQAGQGFDASQFVIAWEEQRATCPQGHPSAHWHTSHDLYDNPVIHVQFAKQDCLKCARRALCTRSREGPRTLKLRPKAQYQALQQARQRQETSEFKEKYQRRAGVEGTISQGTRRAGLRRSRYKGSAKTHLQHICTAVAIHLVRLAAWFVETPRAPTRCSRFAALACT
jgi:transposase